jgi:hypothetical protein
LHMKRTIKIYLEPEDITKLKAKAGTGRGAISEYIRKIAREPIVFLDSNAKELLASLQLTTALK